MVRRSSYSSGGRHSSTSCSSRLSLASSNSETLMNNPFKQLAERRTSRAVRRREALQTRRLSRDIAAASYVTEDTAAVYEQRIAEGHEAVDEYVKARNALRADAVTMQQWVTMRRAVVNRVRKELGLTSKYNCLTKA